MIVPLYNAENYISDCLSSLLAQTFQNFEVIVVDDCSTDGSVKIVESYIPKFGGRLKLSRMQKNSGGAGFPRNKGIEISRGEYVFLVDSDDTINPNAIDNLYSVAKKFDADVVHCEKYWQIPAQHWYDAKFRRTLKPFTYKRGAFVTQPTLITSNILERVSQLRAVNLIWNAGGQFLKRDFLTDNEIKFCSSVNEDLLFTICTLSSAKNYVVIPDVFYYYRRREGSIMAPQLDAPKILHRQVRSLKTGVRYLDEFLSAKPIFSQRPDLKYTLFEMFLQENLAFLYAVYTKVPAPTLDKFLRKEFGDDSAPAAFIFNAMNIYRLQLMQAQQRIFALENDLRRTRP